MPRDRTIEDRVADWLAAYHAIEAEITTPGLHELAGLARASDVQSINVGFRASTIIHENRRAAAAVAESMTHYGLNRTGEDV